MGNIYFVYEIETSQGVRQNVFSETEPGYSALETAEIEIDEWNKTHENKIKLLSIRTI